MKWNDIWVCLKAGYIPTKKTIFRKDSQPSFSLARYFKTNSYLVTYTCFMVHNNVWTSEDECFGVCHELGLVSCPFPPDSGELDYGDSAVVKEICATIFGVALIPNHMYYPVLDIVDNIHVSILYMLTLCIYYYYLLLIFY